MWNYLPTPTYLLRSAQTHTRLSIHAVCTLYVEMHSEATCIYCNTLMMTLIGSIPAQKTCLLHLLMTRRHQVAAVAIWQRGRLPTWLQNKSDLEDESREWPDRRRKTPVSERASLQCRDRRYELRWPLGRVPRRPADGHDRVFPFCRHRRCEPIEAPESPTPAVNKCRLK